MRKYWMLLMCCVCAVSITRSQSYYFKNYQVNNGLSSNSVTCIAQDKKGFLWFGTRNGLDRFDGHTFRIFQYNALDSTSIGSNSILSLVEDRNEKLWVGTYTGVYVYNPLTERFVACKRLPAAQVRSIRCDQENNIWAIVDSTLYKYDTRRDVVTSCKAGTGQTTAFCASPNGTLWTATSHGMVKRCLPGKESFDDFDLAPVIGKQTPNPIQAIYPIGDTALLVGTLKNLLFCDFTSRTTRQLLDGRNSFQVHQILQQSNGDVWVGTETGLCILSMQTGKITLVQKEFDNPYAITDNVVTAFCHDREGGTWIGTFSGGINYFSQLYNAFQKYSPHSGGNGLSGNLAHEICSDQYGNIWIGTEDAGLNRLDPKTGHIDHFSDGQQPGRLAYRNLHGMVADEDELWVGTYEHGLDVLNIETGKVTRHYDASESPTALKSNFITTMFKTNRGDILVGTQNGLFRYDRTNDDFTPMPVFTMPIQCVQEDGDGTLWVGSYGNGVYRYNAATGSISNLRHQEGNDNSIPSNNVTGLFRDSRNILWICSEDGLSKFDPATRIVERVTIETGIPNNQFFRIQEDDQHWIWISSSKGLIHYDPVTEKHNVYTTANGLISDQFNYNSSFRSSDGWLYFGTVKGLIRFRPKLEKNTFEPPVYITSLEINNAEATIGTKTSPLDKSILFTRSIELPYDKSNLSFSVAALSYIAPEKNEYLYKMEGLEKDWTPIKTARKIYYTKLQPGNYVFKVKGSAGGEVWNDRETTLNITIRPPIWASTMAYVLYTVFALGILLIIFRYYHLAITEKNMRKIETLEIEKEREIYNAKVEFFTNITHEIRTPLTLIKLPLDKLMAMPGSNADVNESLKMMKRNTNRLIDLTNQLLDFRKAEADHFSLTFLRTDINELLKETAAPFEKAAIEKGLSFTLETPRLSLQAFIDPEAFRKIVNNLLSNAIKYADHRVVVSLLPFGSDDQTFRIEVRNDGHIIPSDLKGKIFEPFYRIKETEKETGTGIGLPLARSLAELHKGTLELKEPQGGMNVFLLSLPIHQEKEIDFEKHAVADTELSDEVFEGKVADPEKPFVLLVEDSKDILGFVERELEPTYNVLKANNGQEALDILQEENVQLVVSDIMMPVMDGISLCKTMKTDLQFSHIPIILLTAKNTLNSKIQGLEVGADAYIDKPFSLDHLKAQIANLIANRNMIKDYFARLPLAYLKGFAWSKPDAKFLENLHTTINDNIMDTDLDVERLSKLMNISRPTLYRKIKALSNRTPNELIHLSRLEKAAELLRQGHHKINEIALMVGYSLQSNFSRDFRKQFGTTPSEYMSQGSEKGVG